MGLLSKAISIQVVTGRSHGLLRRLTMLSGEISAPAAKVGGAEKSAPAVPRAPGGGGLLKKSLLFLNLEKEESTDSESLIIVDFSENIDRLKWKIGQLAKDFSYFPALYSLLFKELRLAHSAFFLCNPLRGDFTPWMHRGLDARLVPALTFTEKQWAEQGRPHQAEPRLLEDGRRLFPALAGPLPKPLFMFPFTDRGALEGSLLVSNFPVHPDSRASLFGLFRSLSAAVGPTVAGLMRGLKTLPRPERFFRTPAEALSQMMSRGGGSAESIYIALVPLTPLLKTLELEYGFFEAARIREVILYAVNCWLGDLGTGLVAGDRDLVLVTRDNRCYNPRLLSLFITGHLKAFFKGLFDNAPPLIPSRSIEYPVGGALQPEAILARLSP